jgi:hypothetical protein
MGNLSAEVMAARPTARINRRFYTWFVVCAFLIIFAGFARTFYLRTVFETAALPLLLYLHGFLFTAWFVLFFVQARLVGRHLVNLHRKLGIVGAFLAPLCTAVAIRVSFNAGRRGISLLAARQVRSLPMCLRIDFAEWTTRTSTSPPEIGGSA